ncbi:hypothetical protein BWZ22_09760 [Seonamhaeicola sp. S2-3]|uniref:hypothetical protein n=1 Tax=Seonamhaeicola sp. S2-3 TaxID=1936081 RepID=UPI000972982F|nr:hypothetical protein [Seonamhaeicola sp. S2-3]APY11512.1 hypothetical protein BWZ22_09760 [Seonamhaeicola sp. S2-3]
MQNPFETLQQEIKVLGEKIDALSTQPNVNKSASNTDPLADFIPKTEVRGKLASSSTLWKYEKEGIIDLFSIGGKRFYKKSQLINAFTKLKK